MEIESILLHVLQDIAMSANAEVGHPAEHRSSKSCCGSGCLVELGVIDLSEVVGRVVADQLRKPQDVEKQKQTVLSWIVLHIRFSNDDLCQDSWFLRGMENADIQCPLVAHFDQVSALIHRADPSLSGVDDVR